jgi:PrtD family type I secretion system ABC transporter
MLNNAEVVNGMGMGPAVYKRFDENNKKIILDQTVASRFAGMAQSSIKSIQIFMNVMIYGLGAWLVIVEYFDPGLMIAASIIMGQAISPFMRALAGAKSISQARDAYNRLHDFSHTMSARSVRMSLPSPKGALRAEGVFFAIDGRVLLYNISLDLEAGEFLGLVGPNGAGKTTLSRVLLGIWPALGGSVRLDGVDMFQWDKKELGLHVGYLPQTVELFPASVADNIARLGAPDMEEVQRVCRQVGINSLIEALPQGYDTQIGAGSKVVFSGGQKQRIGLARALYGSPTLLVLDEPNSNLDEAGEECLLRVLEDIRSTRGATCVIISHKNELLRMVDKMLLLQGGRVVSFGPRDQVLQTIFKASQASPSGQPGQPPLTVRATENA